MRHMQKIRGKYNLLFLISGYLNEKDNLLEISEHQSMPDDRTTSNNVKIDLERV